MSAPEKVLDKLRKLMTLAQDGGASDGEVDNAMRFARALMDKYDLAEADVILHETPAESAGKVVEQEALHLKQIHHHDIRLGQACESLCDVKMYTELLGRAGKKLIFYGRQRDVEVARALFSELRVIMRTMARHVTGISDGDSHRAYLYGFSSRVLERARAMRREPVANTTTALVHVKDAALVRYAEGLHLTKGRPMRETPRDFGAYDAGRRDGERVQLGKNGLGSAKPSKAKQLYSGAE